MSNTQPTPLSDDYFRARVEEFLYRTADYQVITSEFALYQLLRGHSHDLYLLLKEVSKDTRHACAEVRALPPAVTDSEDGRNGDDNPTD